MSKPDINEIPEFYQKYVQAVNYTDLIPALINSGNETIDLLKSIPEKSADYKYAEGKWTIRQVIAHMIDTERVFAYRALRFSRNDKTQLPGFEQNDWAVETNAENRKLYKLIEEYNNVRASTIDLFGSFNEEMLKRVGNANGSEMSVNALGFIIVGHETHHRNILNERYFS
ncbi:DinB family protein [Fulvivirga lutea]|uniref:DinB family protein n=1 Tax=Fulvivirga lutea TaxID=2810512 RepID=A0A974WHT7_9BACT|nr:DinB family protein [Fulvivirga lutea]QSE98003.1 DinB family protein [Fulvivirga lutea]